MIASTSIAARDSRRVSVLSRVISQARSPAVRNVHLLAMRTRLTPRVAYSACNCASAAFTSTPSGMRLASVAVSSGSADANNNASRSRSSSGRASGAAGVSSASSMSFSAKLAMTQISFLLFRRGDGVGSLRRALPEIKRREGLFLVQLHLTLAHQFQRRGEARGKDRCLLRGIDHVAHQIIVETAPVLVVSHADQALQRGARFGQRPDGTLGKMHTGENALLTLRGIGG